jgi:hypothetical protein
MIPALDLWMLGLRLVRAGAAAHIVPTSGAAQPFREMGEMFPGWAARPLAGAADPRSDVGGDEASALEEGGDGSV